jgi:G:T-mismatch repair DNA endonuclease (very short patch repair protein)
MAGRTNLDSSGLVRPFYFCDACDTVSERVLNSCPTCGAAMPGAADVLFVSRFEAEDQARITSLEDVRERRRFEIRDRLVEEGIASVTLFEYPFLPIEHRRMAKILRTNWGRQDPETREGERFAICTECGRHRPAAPDQASRWNEQHARYCPGSCELLVLGYEFRTDALVATIPPQPGKTGYDEALLVSAAEALLIGASTYLETETFEIGAFPRRTGVDPKTGQERPGQIVLFESVPGGAGYLEELAANLPRAAAAAYERLFGHACVHACYLCLKRYGNQRWHRLLNKELVRDWLFDLSLADPVQGQTAVPGHGQQVLLRQLAERAAEVRDGHYAKGPIEEVLLDALHRLGDVPEPERDHEIRSDTGALVTVPDFVWADARIAVYCDGYQFHGDRDTLELDATKRNYLVSRGWRVLTYWGRTILRHPDRCAAEIARILRADEARVRRPHVARTRSTEALSRAAEGTASYQAR